MTGKVHNKHSQLLYIKRFLNGEYIDGITPTNNVKPLKNTNKRRRRKRKKRTTDRGLNAKY